MSRLFLTIIFTASVISLFITRDVFASTINQSSASTSNLNSGLLGWWTFDGANTWSTTTTDKSGKGNHGGLTNGVAVTTGKIGQASKFNGSNWVTLSSNVDVSASGSTISLWFKPSVISPLILLGKEANGNTYVFMQSATAILVQTDVVSTVKTFNVPTLLADNWYHLTVTRNNNTTRVYLNGVESSSGGQTQTDVLTINGIGRYHSGDIGFNWKGLFDDVRIYNRALSLREIQQLYQMGGSKISQTPAATSNLNSGLVGWWTFDGVNTGATYTTDKSGNGNTGTRNSGVAVTAGKIGQAMKLDGVDDNINILNSTSLNTANSQITVSFWTRNNVNPAQYDGLMGRNATTEWTNGWGFFYQSATEIRFFIQSFSANVASATLTPTNWNHVVGVWNGSSIRIFINGVEGTSDSYSGTMTTTDPLTLGRLFNNLYNINGLIDDTRVYNRALSVREIQQLYQMGGGKISQTPPATVTLNSGLVGWWTFDGANTWSTTTTDKSGTGNNGGRYGNTAVTAGKIGQAMKFDGVDDYVNAGVISQWNHDSNYTLSAWIKTPIFASVSMHIMGEYTSGQWGGAYLHLSGTTLWFRESDNLTSSNVFSVFGTSNIVNGKWHHVVGVRQLGANAKVYVDGVLENSGADTQAATSFSRPFFMGTSSNLTYDFNGSIDDARLYTRALSAKEIKQLYQMGK